MKEFTDFFFRNWILIVVIGNFLGALSNIVSKIIVSGSVSQKPIQPTPLTFYSGFFGIAVLGQLLRALAQQPWLAWVPGFPYSERLNILTAGCLLALIAVPTIFTLAEDALNNVPRAFKEA